MVKKWYSNGEDLKEHNPKTIDKPRLFKETKSNMKLGIVGCGFRRFPLSCGLVCGEYSAQLHSRNNCATAPASLAPIRRGLHYTQPPAAI